MFCGTWLLVLALYAGHMSALLQYSTEDVVKFEAPLLLSFLIALAIAMFLPTRLILPARWMLSADRATIQMLDKRLRFWFRLWAVCSVAEIIVSGGVPIVWIVTGNPKTYMDFGIPSIHGLLNSMLLAIAITRLAMAFRFGRKKDYIIPACTVFWGTCLITRQVIIVLLLEAIIVYCYQRRLRAKQLLKGVFGASAFIYCFGLLGDFRSGASSFLALAQPTANFPDWLPSGFLWVYIYLTTPINNLLFTIQTSHPAYDPRFTNTLSALLPTLLRNIVFDSVSLQAANGELVADAFNVSTAYAAPFQDFGWLGILIFTVVFAGMAGIFWRKYTLRDQLCYAVVCQCLILTVFYNHFFYLPVIFQILWLYVFFRGTGGNINSAIAPVREAVTQ
jgi:oligosaccharide repeat unit polymerase